MPADYDIFIIGGGINGCGIARDASGRGYSVYLCEQNDLASGTSSRSTKLIHGGLRYPEYFEFRLVREALSEREILWNIAPHIVHPMRFILPVQKGRRPAWLLRLGLFIYDHLGGRNKLPATSTLNLQKDSAGQCLRDKSSKAFEYSDCTVDDARLVILNALDARERGANIQPQTRCINARRVGKHWSITVQGQPGMKQKNITASILINATGPWADRIIDMLDNDESNQAHKVKKAHNIRLVQGSHIVVPKLYAHKKSYLFQNNDKRIFFAIPYKEKYTLIGTTDYDFSGDPGDSKITETEIDYLCRAANQHFKNTINKDDIIWSYAGVRSLYNDNASKAQEATRDYVLRVDQKSPDHAPLINVFGGKITTYRHLATSVLEKIENLISNNNPLQEEEWTATSPLPGGDFPTYSYNKNCQEFFHKFDFLPEKTAQRLFSLYGTKAYQVLGNAKNLDDLGISFSHGLYQKEVEYLMHEEWAQSADDILWRRTKLGLEMGKQEKQTLIQWIDSHNKPSSY